MKPLFQLLSIAFLTLTLVACKVKQQPIPYGQANCQHCQMTVADKRFGSELVNKTGKAYYFDSSECLMQYLLQDKEAAQKAALVLVSDFGKSEKLTDAKKAVFLQSKNLPSPMGMFLTAFEKKADAEALQQKNGGQLLTWEQALERVRNHEKPE